MKLLAGTPWTFDPKSLYAFHIETTVFALKGVGADVPFQILVLERI